MNNEPVRITTSITAAVVATIGLLAITLDLSPELTGSLTVVAGAWIKVLGIYLREQVSPVNPKEMT